jgi:biofilm PGA synthesis N-glycosyltransferase PgaC
MTSDAVEGSRTQGPARRKFDILLISPVRDEERTVETTIACMRAQTVTPRLWVLVDDGSSDQTLEILERAASEVPWIRVVHRADRGSRKLGAGVIDAFYAGLDVADAPYDVIGKVDGDLWFSPRYLEILLGRFGDDAKLAAASGKLFRQTASGLVEEFMVDGMVAGAFQFYRREVFEEIGGFVRGVMWDGIAFHRTRLAEYRTESFHDSELRLVELRPMGASDRSVLRGRLRWGAGQWFMGSALPYVVASGLFRMIERPYVIGGLLIIAGYLMGAARGAPRYEDAEFRRGLRRWQYSRLGGLLRGRGIR